MSSATTLSDFFEQTYLLKPKMAGGSAETHEAYRVDLRILQVYFSKLLAKTDQPPKTLLVTDLSVDLINGAMKFQIDRGRAKPTANRLRRVVVSLWNYAHEKGFHDKPAPKIERFTEPKRDPLAWSIDEFGRILFAASELEGNIGPHSAADWTTAVLWLTYNSGLRITATMATRLDWLDLGQRRLVVDPEVQKDDEGQTIILLPETVEAIERIIVKGQPGLFDDWPYDRGASQWNSLNKHLKKLIVAAGLCDSVEKVSRRDLWHKIRRTFATAIYIASGDIEVAREMLGHSSSDITWRYIDKSKLNRKSQADLLPTPQPNKLRIFQADGAG